jgi:alkanesulfonate monooxygenase SsuD/methylene tetrahydromethanopterin reductase-like flavin-dependent oxidoreductase (luciferase family)
VTHPWVAEGQQRLRFGVGVLSPRTGIAQAIEHARLAEDLGLDSFWVQDHPTSGPDCWSTLAALGAATARLRLGSFVSCVYYRTPFQLARLAADVDRLSGGRLILGLGTGDAPGEFGRLGLDWPPARERQATLEETLRAVLRLWGGASPTADARGSPVEGPLRAGPVQQPRVPVLIGGGGERVTLRYVARVADMANFGPTEQTGGAATPAGVRHKYAVLRGHCEALGRPYQSVLRSYYMGLVLAATPAALAAKLRGYYPAGGPAEQPPSLDAAVDHVGALAAAGVQHFIAAVRGDDLETIRLFAERLVPAVRARSG